MNLPSEAQAETRTKVPGYFPGGAAGSPVTAAFRVPEIKVAPFEFRSLTGQDIDGLGGSVRPGNGLHGGGQGDGLWAGGEGGGNLRAGLGPGKPYHQKSGKGTLHGVLKAGRGGQ